MNHPPSHTNPPRPVVASVLPGSLAAAAGVAAGDVVLRVNGRSPRDYIEYRYLIAEEHVSLAIEKPDGALRRLRIAKDLDADLGLRFTSDVFDGILPCANACAFCFVAQLPRGMRPALYVKDDDYRLSFLHGNFITLTNLTPEDRRRIARFHISPLYVSVQATEPEVRRRLFGRETVDPRAEMRRLARRGIEFHTQVVVCPGINDGEHLAQTVHDLAELHPAVQSIGLVPVGLTQHRGKLAALPAVTPELAAGIVAQVARWQRDFRARLGARLVYASDELFLRAERPLPGRAYYDDFPQLGNGIGNVRLFLDDLKKMTPPRLSRPTRVTLVTGEQAAGLVQQLAEKLAASERLQAEVCVVPNRFFGRSVTTAGLLTGADIAHALSECGVGEVVVVPGTAVREGEGFLDNLSVSELETRIGAPVLVADWPRELARALARWDLERGKHV